MTNHEPTHDAADFSGQVRLLALPDVVMFPHVMQPLHIFEPRFRQLVDDALRTDRLLALGTLTEVQPAESEHRARVEPHGCLCKIVAHHGVIGGDCNILLTGMHRVEFRDEVACDKLYPIMNAVLHADVSPEMPAHEREALIEALREAILNAMHELPNASEYLEQLFSFDISLGMLTDVAAYVLDLDREEKLALLAEPNIIERAHHILGHLVTPETEFWSAWPRNIAFPPEFSMN